MRNWFRSLPASVLLAVFVAPFVLVGAAIGWSMYADRVPVRAETTQASQPTEHGQYAEVTVNGQTATIRVEDAKPSGAPVLTGWDPSSATIETTISPVPAAAGGALLGLLSGFFVLLATSTVHDWLEDRREDRVAALAG